MGFRYPYGENSNDDSTSSEMSSESWDAFRQLVTTKSSVDFGSLALKRKHNPTAARNILKTTAALPNGSLMPPRKTKSSGHILEKLAHPGRGTLGVVSTKNCKWMSCQNKNNTTAVIASSSSNTKSSQQQQSQQQQCPSASLAAVSGKVSTMLRQQRTGSKATRLGRIGPSGEFVPGKKNKR